MKGWAQFVGGQYPEKDKGRGATGPSSDNRRDAMCIWGVYPPGNFEKNKAPNWPFWSNLEVKLTAINVIA